ncbi:DNA adenine methylase [Salmonella sp. SG118]
MDTVLTGNISSRRRIPSQPFLKWAGGKRRSLDRLQRWLPSPEEVECLVEPFVGGAICGWSQRFSGDGLPPVSAGRYQCRPD